jgi:hypothetical protein
MVHIAVDYEVSKSTVSRTFKTLSKKYRDRHKRFSLCFNPVCALINFDRGFGLK